MYRLSLALALALVGAAAQQQTALDPPLQHAVELHHAGDLAAAIGEYRAYLGQHPDSIEARSNLGAAYASAGRLQDAIDEYNRALELQPGNPAVTVNLAIAYYKTARLADAARELESVLSKIPQNRQVTFLLADCDIQLGENKKAVELLAPWEKESMDDQAYNYLYGTALVRDKQADKGGVVIDRILRNGESAQSRLLMGTTKMWINDFKGAAAELERAIELDPRLPDAHAYYGQALLGTNDPVGAAAAFRKEVELNPNHFMANLELGMISKQDQNYSDAQQSFERALRSRPGDPGVRYQLATIDIALGKTDEARRGLERLVKESPQFTEAHVSLATVYYRLKHKEDGDRERAIVQKLNAEKQAAQPGANAK